MELVKTIKETIAELIVSRREILSGTLTTDHLKELKVQYNFFFIKFFICKPLF